MSFRHRFPLLRPLAGLLLFTWLCMAPGAWAQAPDDPAAEAKTQLNQADVINRAIQIMGFLERQTSDGGELLIRKNGETEKVTII